MRPPIARDRLQVQRKSSREYDAVECHYPDKEFIGVSNPHHFPEDLNVPDPQANEAARAARAQPSPAVLVPGR